MDDFRGGMAVAFGLWPNLVEPQAQPYDYCLFSRRRQMSSNTLSARGFPSVRLGGRPQGP